MQELNNFESLRISLASPEKIRGLVQGEVKTETINYRTLKPERKAFSVKRCWSHEGLGMPLQEI